MAKYVLVIHVVIVPGIFRVQENKKELPWLVDYGSHLVHLAVFGILGVMC